MKVLPDVFWRAPGTLLRIPLEKLPDGGRRYFYDVKGQYGWTARYVKEVDAMEQTIKFYQNIYDDTGMLVEVHEKYPEDKGHRKV